VILLDTSVLSQVFRRRKPGPLEQQTRSVVEGLIAGEASLGLPGIVLMELLSGIRSARQFAELQQHLLSSFTIVLPTVADHVEAARLRNKCLTKGISASGPDCLIAALAIAGQHELFTLDNDFRALAKLAPLKLFEYAHDA
jgi:predicted nucleic acid-binding protein